jgi:hypothetical protein
MRLSEILYGLRLFWKWWTWFWFRPVSARGVGILRITMGLMMAMTTIDVWPDLELFVGPNGIWSESAANRGFRLSRWTYFDQIDTMEGMYLAQGMALVFNVLFMLGFKSRTMGFLSVLTHVAIYQRNSWFMNGGDRLIRECAFYLCLVPCGAAYSVDAWLRDRKLLRTGQKVIKDYFMPIVGNRLIQFQLIGMYFLSGIEKWESSSWQKGSALYYSLSTANYARSDIMLAPLLDGKLGYEFLKIGTWVTLYWEVYFGLLVLWRPTRYLALFVGVFMHIGIHVTLIVAFFSAVSVWCYLTFLPHDWVERCISLWQTWKEKRALKGQG